jgi:hypothetical protein
MEPSPHRHVFDPGSDIALGGTGTQVLPFNANVLAGQLIASTTIMTLENIIVNINAWQIFLKMSDINISR